MAELLRVDVDEWRAQLPQFREHLAQIRPPARRARTHSCRRSKSVWAEPMAVAIPPVDPERVARPRRSSAAMTAFALTGFGTWYSSQLGARIDPWLLRVHARPGGPHARLDPGRVLLTVRGARSGRERKVPLLYFTDGDDVILVASSYGRAKFPAWYYNLKANPDVRLEAMGRSGSYVAREVEGRGSRSAVRRLAKLVYSGYSSYEQRTAGIRRIPVMRLSPA